MRAATGDKLAGLTCLLIELKPTGHDRRMSLNTKPNLTVERICLSNKYSAVHSIPETYDHSSSSFSILQNFLCLFFKAIVLHLCYYIPRDTDSYQVNTKYAINIKIFKYMCFLVLKLTKFISTVTLFRSHATLVTG